MFTEELLQVFFIKPYLKHYVHYGKTVTKLDFRNEGKPEFYAFFRQILSGSL